MALTIGFIGSGHIATAMVKGLCTAGDPPERVIVSDKFKEKAEALAALFPQVEATTDNQALLDESDAAFICVLPQIAPDVLKPLKFRKEHIVVTVVAIRPLDEMKGYVAPAQKVVRAVPLPPVARHLGPVVFYPEIPEVSELFGKMGALVPVKSEHELVVLSGITGLISPYYALLDTFLKVAVEAGVDEKMAAKYITAMFLAQTQLAADSEDADFGELAAQAATPGGINEQALREIREVNGYEVFAKALKSLLKRLGVQ